MPKPWSWSCDHMCHCEVMWWWLWKRFPSPVLDSYHADFHFCYYASSDRKCFFFSIWIPKCVFFSLSFFYTMKFVVFFCLNLRYSVLKAEKAGKGRKKPQGECISGWPTCFSEAFSRPDPKGATLTNLKWHHGCPQELSLSRNTLHVHKYSCSQGQIGGSAPSFALSMTKWAVSPLPGGYTTPQSTRWLQYLSGCAMSEYE